MKTSGTFAFIFSLLIMISVSASDSRAQGMSPRVLRHVVMFSFKDGTAPADIRKVEQAFVALRGKIPQIKGLEWGTNNSPENLNQGLTHCFLLSFSSEQDRDAYLVHPEHEAFASAVKSFVDKVTVVDYWATEVR